MVRNCAAIRRLMVICQGIKAKGNVSKGAFFRVIRTKSSDVLIMPLVYVRFLRYCEKSSEVLVMPSVN